MEDAPTTALLVLHLLAAASAGFNAVYFGTLPALSRRRRTAAWVLTLACLGTALQSLAAAGALAPAAPGGNEHPALGLAAAAVAAAGSLGITGLVLRRLLSGR